MRDAAANTEWAKRWLCRFLGHKIVTGYHSAGSTTYCERCRVSETRRVFS